LAKDKQRVAFIRHGVVAWGSLSLIATIAFVGPACSSDDALAPPSAGGAGGAAGKAGAGLRDGGGASGAAPDGAGTGGATGGAAGTTGAGGTSGASGTGGAAGKSGGGGAGGSAGTAGTGGASGASGSGGAAGSSGGASTDAGTAVDVGSGIDTGAPDAATDVGVARPPCMKSPNQVVVLGDSYVNWISHTFPSDLAKEAGVTYRMYAVGGTAMGSGGIGLIAPQLDQAVAADPNIIAVVMDGGGNDILVPDTAQFPQGGDCKQNAMSPTIPDCQKIIQKAVDKATEMMNTAADKGVKDIVYFFYPHVPEGTLIGGAHPNAILDYAFPLVKATCDGARARTGGRLTCHFLDLIPVFDGHPDWFAATDIHPNPTGSAAMAKGVWQMMKDACIAQPASSGCCAP